MAWSDKKTKMLIQLWGEEDIQVQLEDWKQNIAVYKQISKEMKAAKFNHSAVQCREKMKLTTLYKSSRIEIGWPIEVDTKWSFSTDLMKY